MKNQRTTPTVGEFLVKILPCLDLNTEPFIMKEIKAMKELGIGNYLTWTMHVLSQ